MRTVQDIESDLEVAQATAEALQKELEEAKKQKWRPTKYEAIITTDLRANYTPPQFFGFPSALEAVGNTFETIEIAMAYAKELKNLFLINAWIREENKRTGWVADWSNFDQIKAMIEFNSDIHQFAYILTRNSKSLGAEYISIRSAEKLCELVNSGMIEGIEL